MRFARGPELYRTGFYTMSSEVLVSRLWPLGREISDITNRVNSRGARRVMHNREKQTMTSIGKCG